LYQRPRRREFLEPVGARYQRYMRARGAVPPVRYIEEQAFRFNNRNDVDGEVIVDSERFEAAFSKIVGKRLTYKALIGKEEETASTQPLGKCEAMRQGRGKRSSG
jgi:hypothetical protein